MSLVKRMSMPRRIMSSSTPLLSQYSLARSIKNQAVTMAAWIIAASGNAGSFSSNGSTSLLPIHINILGVTPSLRGLCTDFRSIARARIHSRHIPSVGSPAPAFLCPSLMAKIA